MTLDSICSIAVITTDRNKSNTMKMLNKQTKKQFLKIRPNTNVKWK